MDILSKEMGEVLDDLIGLVTGVVAETSEVERGVIQLVTKLATMEEVSGLRGIRQKMAFSVFTMQANEVRGISKDLQVLRSHAARALEALVMLGVEAGETRERAEEARKMGDTSW